MLKNSAAKEIISGTKNSSVLTLLRYKNACSVSAASMHRKISISIHGSAAQSLSDNSIAEQLRHKKKCMEIIRELR